MLGSGCQAAVMEVSSHGLDQNRVDEIDYSIALFTNLTPEHLDYHGNMEAYKRAKEKLFTRLKENTWAVLNCDSPYTFETKAKVFTYGIVKQADLMAKEILFTDKGTHFVFNYRGEEIPCYSPLIGQFNVYNVLGAVAVGLCSGISLEDCAESMKSFKGILGRLQKVKTPFGAHVFVDFAHKEEALEKTLQALNAIKKKRVITVFGCGGDRDRQKRKKMGAIAEKYSDLTIVTSDNPRSEDPTKIASEILEGFSLENSWIFELDRKKAIEKALDLAEKEDMILIAGKGHEKEQIFAHHVIPFDDVAVVEKYCREKICR